MLCCMGEPSILLYQDSLVKLFTNATSMDRYVDPPLLSPLIYIIILTKQIHHLRSLALLAGTTYLWGGGRVSLGNVQLSKLREGE